MSSIPTSRCERSLDRIATCYQDDALGLTRIRLSSAELRATCSSSLLAFCAFTNVRRLTLSTSHRCWLSVPSRRVQISKNKLASLSELNRVYIVLSNDRALAPTSTVTGRDKEATMVIAHPSLRTAPQIAATSAFDCLAATP